MDIFATVVSQTMMTFEVARKVKALFINLENKNKEFANKTSQTEEAVERPKLMLWHPEAAG